MARDDYKLVLIRGLFILAKTYPKMNYTNVRPKVNSSLKPSITSTLVLRY